MTQGFESALKTALEMLRASDKFRAEIERRLAQKGQEEPTIRLVFDWLDSKRLLDDHRVAEEAVRRMSATGNAGPELIRAKLLARGAPEGVVDKVLSQRTVQDEILAATQFVDKKSKPNSTRMSIFRALSTKGFSEEVSYAVVNERFGYLPDNDEVRGD